MSPYRLTPAAQRDLSSIWDCTAERWDPRQAETSVREVQAAIERFAADPSRGRSVEEVRERYRRYPVGSHLLFYVPRGSGVDIIRILHQRMDPSLHL